MPERASPPKPAVRFADHLDAADHCRLDQLVLEELSERVISEELAGAFGVNAHVLAFDEIALAWVTHTHRAARSFEARSA